MVVIYGSKMFGKVDEVPGLFHVATKFGHIYYIPLIPLGSHLVLDEDSDGWRGVSVGLSLRSWFWAWVRTAAVIGILAGMIMTFIAIGETGGQWWIPLIIAIASLVAFVFSKMGIVQRASYQRACELAELAGFPDEIHDLLKLTYGRCRSTREADELAKRFESIGEEPE